MIFLVRAVEEEEDCFGGRLLIVKQSARMKEQMNENRNQVNEPVSPMFHN